jgi:hypothetical protein
MNDLSLDFLVVLIILLPGFLTASIVRLLHSSLEKTDFEKIVEALTYAFFDFAIYSAVFAPTRTLFDIVAKSLEKNGPFPASSLLIILSPTSVGLLFAISIFLGTAIAMLLNVDSLWLLRKIKVTKKTTRSGTYFDVFSDKSKSFVTIHFSDGRRLFGWPLYFDDTPKDPYLFLSSAKWLEDDGGEIDIKGEGILVTPNNKIEFIEFLGT